MMPVSMHTFWDLSYLGRSPVGRTIGGPAAHILGRQLKRA
jgi:hypothetical protein